MSLGLSTKKVVEELRSCPRQVRLSTCFSEEPPGSKGVTSALLQLVEHPGSSTSYCFGNESVPARAVFSCEAKRRSTSKNGDDDDDEAPDDGNYDAYKAFG